ncbi:serine hydrolase domain-containing protein [Lacrimispora sp. 210928-DFI.3.58]|uniref:serine hydrolase domain-containing protein n=1 Tax=Lacrimispora sp. 210928-DFI.3.58 TaxID=2883214 RepID=UPI0015B767E4|nr:serine hydrolase [Lacrimispora sp. 210928-DFI.3.58]MCB7319319.1 beta-lactamase family protein [Lacrimispora sp. 210928-DFI.3.58]
MYKGKNLVRCSLAEAGISAEGVKGFLEEIEKGGYHLHSFMLTRHGKVAYECSWAPYRLDEVHLMHSFTKGLVATAIGILEGERRIALDDAVISYFPEYEVDHQGGRLDRITLRTLLTMTNGHTDTAERHGCDDEVYAFLKRPVVNEPGSVFMYDSMGTNMLAAIVKRVTGYNLFQFLQLRIFEPLGICGVCCDSCTSGKDQGGGGSRLKTEDMAKITILYLNEGIWEGRQLIPRDWVRRMTSVQFEDSMDASNPDWEDWKCGYGYQVWMCRIPNTFRFDGMYGQFGIVLKDLDASVITTCGECNTEAVLRLVWKYLVPAMEEESLPENQGELEEELFRRKDSLHIIWPMEQETGSREAELLWGRIWGRDIMFPPNRESVLAASRVNNCFTSTWTEQHRTGIKRLRFEAAEGEGRLYYEDNCNHGMLPVGMSGIPKRGLLRSLWGDYEVWTAARWLDGGSLEMQIRMVQGEYYQVFTIIPDEKGAEVRLYSGPWDRRTGKPDPQVCLCSWGTENGSRD